MTMDTTMSLQISQSVKLRQTLSQKMIQYVTPDITIVKFSDRFEILLNQYSYPEIRVNKYYLKLLRSDCDQETKEYLSAKLKQIEETQEHIPRRGSTLMALSKFLLERQERFLYPWREPSNLSAIRRSVIFCRKKALLCQGALLLNTEKRWGSAAQGSARAGRRITR